MGHGKRGYGQAIDERIPRVAHQASWRLRSGLEITALCFWIFVQIWIGFSAFMIYESVFKHVRYFMQTVYSVAVCLFLTLLLLEKL